MTRTRGLLLATAVVAALLGAGATRTSQILVSATSCTNQFVRSIAAATGVGTCATVGSNDLASSLSLTTPNIGAATATSVNFGGSSLANYVSAGSWTPTDGSGAGLSLTVSNAQYTRIGNMVFAYAQITYPSTASGAAAQINGLPITVGPAKTCLIGFRDTAAASLVTLLANSGATTISPLASTSANLTNANLTAATFAFNCIYPVS